MAPQEGEAVPCQHCLTSTGDIVGQWKEYFEDLLNPTIMSSIEEAETEGSEVDSSITQAEVTEVVKKLLGCKAALISALSTSSPWMLWGCLGWHTSAASRGGQGQCLCNGRPGWWSLFSRRGTGGCVPTTGGSHSSATPGMSMPGYWRGEFG